MSDGFAYHSPYNLGRGLPSHAVELPSCVTPSLAYYQIGSCAPLTNVSEETEGKLRALSITGFSMGDSAPVREYQPVVHRLRLSASP